MSDNLETKSLSKYYLNKFAGGIKKFTETMVMKSIVNGFISVMPVIIVASIFTLLSALPEMFISVIYSGVERIDPNTGMVIPYVDWLKSYTGFGDYQAWAAVISNWSMGVLGIFVTMAISKNMATFINEKLPSERKINELTVMFAAISTYLMLSVIEFTVNGSSGILISSEVADHTGRAIFVDGLAAQGILPGILIALSMPWIFYFTNKNNITIRLPKQVPQTISQAFLGITPLLITFGLFGSAAFLFNFFVGQPLLFWLFSLIQSGLAGNEALNNSYGLIAIYTIMESGFWFLGVHPEPVHAVMRSTFWFENIDANAAGGNNLFTEPYMYGYGAMGGSGCTLAVPYLCLLFGRSTEMKTVGKTGWLPIIFQVNEPTLFGVPCILNPIFFIPMMFTGMINDMLFKLLADSTGFQAGSLYLPWSAPYFLTTSLGTPTAWQPWVFDFIALAICFIMFAPFVLIQDKLYVQAEARKLGGDFKLPANGWDNFKQKLLLIDPNAKLERKLERDTLKAKKIKSKEMNVSKLKSEKNTKEAASKKVNKPNKTIIKHKKNKDRLINIKKFIDDSAATKLTTVADKVDVVKDNIVTKFSENTKKAEARAEKCEVKISGLESDVATLKALKTLLRKVVSKTKPSKFVKEQNATKYEMQLQKISKKLEEVKTCASNKEVKQNKKHIRSLKSKIEKLTNKHDVLVALKEGKKPHRFTRIKIIFINNKINAITSKITTLKNKKPKGFRKFKVKKTVSFVEMTYTAKVKYKQNLETRRLVKSCVRRDKKLIKMASKNKVTLLPIDVSKYESILQPNFLKNEKASYKSIKKEAKKILKDEASKINSGINIYASTTKKPSLVKKNDEALSVEKTKKGYEVLVICLGAGSSAVLANTIAKGLRAKGHDEFNCFAAAWGSHEAALKKVDMVILSPQMGANLVSMKKAATEYGFKLHATRGRDYIDLSRNPAKAAELVLNELGVK